MDSVSSPTVVPLKRKHRYTSPVDLFTTDEKRAKRMTYAWAECAATSPAWMNYRPEFKVADEPRNEDSSHTTEEHETIETQDNDETDVEKYIDLGHTNGKLTLWQFLLELLLSKRHHNIIRWTEKEGEFVLLQAERVAKMWGLRKDQNHRMNYDKLSRALRYYYEKNIIRKVHGHKFVYQFIDLRNLMKFYHGTTWHWTEESSAEVENAGAVLSNPRPDPSISPNLPGPDSVSNRKDKSLHSIKSVVHGEPMTVEECPPELRFHESTQQIFTSSNGNVQTSTATPTTLGAESEVHKVFSLINNIHPVSNSPWKVRDGQVQSEPKATNLSSLLSAIASLFAMGSSLPATPSPMKRRSTEYRDMGSDNSTGGVVQNGDVMPVPVNKAARHSKFPSSEHLFHSPSVKYSECGSQNPPVSTTFGSVPNGLLFPTEDKNFNTASQRCLQQQQQMVSHSPIPVLSGYPPRASSPGCQCSCHMTPPGSNVKEINPELSVESGASVTSDTGFGDRPPTEITSAAIHHHRHEINMMRLEEQISRLHRTSGLNLPHPKTPRPFPTATIPEFDTRLPHERVMTHNNTPDTVGPDLVGNNPCVWMPVPVLMLATWFNLLGSTGQFSTSQQDDESTPLARHPGSPVTAHDLTCHNSAKSPSSRDNV